MARHGAWAIALMCLWSMAGLAQRPRPGEPLELRGVLRMAPAGRLQFVTVNTDGAIPSAQTPSPEHDAKLHSLALAGYHDYALLYAHRGQTVLVRGTLLRDDTSPYFKDGMRLQLDSIRTVDGIDLTGARQSPATLAADVGSYRVQVTLPADLAAPWRYATEDRADARGMLSCSSNGGGDVVNCLCAGDFHAIAGDQEIGGRQSSATLFSGMAQFATGDDAQRVVLHVTCSR